MASGGAFWKWHEHFKALILPHGEPFTKDLINDSNRPAQERWQENTQTLICWTYVWFAFCPRRWITLIPAAWKAEWVAAQGASDYGRHPAHHRGTLGNGGPGPSLMLLERYEVRDGGEMAFSGAAERLRGLDMIM